MMRLFSVLELEAGDTPSASMAVDLRRILSPDLHGIVGYFPQSQTAGLNFRGTIFDANYFVNRLI